MRFERALLTLLLGLNVFMFWRMQSLTDAASPGPRLEAPAAAAPAAVAVTAGDEAALSPGLAELRAALGKLSARVDELEETASAAPSGAEPERYSDERSAAAVIDGFGKDVRQRFNQQEGDDWFWNEPSGSGNNTLSFAPSENFNVNSVICSDEWCRVEIEEYNGKADTGLEADLELQLQIDESLGRDTEIRFGPRQGNNRVVYIR